MVKVISFPAIFFASLSPVPGQKAAGTAGGGGLLWLVDRGDVLVAVQFCLPEAAQQELPLVHVLDGRAVEVLAALHCEKRRGMRRGGGKHAADGHPQGAD